MRIEPPPSLAVARGVMPEASAAAEPPLEPPGVRSRFHGFRVGAEEIVIGEGDVAELGRICLAHDDRAGGLQPGHERVVEIDAVVAVEAGPFGRDETGRVLEVLDAQRQSRERPHVLARRQAVGKRPRLSQGPLRVHLDEGVEAGVELFDAGQRALHELDR